MMLSRRLAALEAVVAQPETFLAPEVEQLVAEAFRRQGAGRRLTAKQQAAFDVWFALPDGEGKFRPFEKLSTDELRALGGVERWPERVPA
jgi:hypothetical protein